MRSAGRRGARLALPLLLLLLLVRPPLRALAADESTESGASAELELELKLPQPPKLDRAQSRKLLLEVVCGHRCDSVSWQIRLSGERLWRTAQWRAHSGYRDTFYVSGLQPGRRYQVRALLAASPRSRPYTGDDVPLLDVTTCPERPQAVRNLTLHSAGPGWLEVRWEPPPKEACSSHVFYEVRYGPVPAVRFPQWRPYGYFRADGWIYFRPTHPCAAWPRLFCLLLTDAVQAGERHRIEVRTTRFDESPAMFSHGVTVMAEADTSCITSATCGDIGGAEPLTTAPPLVFPNTTGPSTTRKPIVSTTQPGRATTYNLDRTTTHKTAVATPAKPNTTAAITTTIKPEITTMKVTNSAKKPMMNATTVRGQATTRRQPDASTESAAGERDEVGEEATPAPEPELGCWNGSEGPAGRTQLQPGPGPEPASGLQRAAPLLLFLLLLACAALPPVYFLGRRMAKRADPAGGPGHRSSWRRGGTAAETQPVLTDEVEADMDDGPPGENGRVSLGWLRAQEA